ncbi:4-(cytidine 5'-diphospho)-2-C-methyl-D-erythritol kinase [Rhodothermus profundi]|uniref:4-diphosphocytidyl-2-C-methyl-D-erythritol kinase n=1 Tax=Rhodothermus profundi TaxID=633813 RepID=A0A1M6URW5_9BACT|nr:4-(cytidine 5'-diphospho)-2-C-methyl-D-erythritol kinase [Rhodothermus profundi]SHK71913.1 4-diphosphocytidyl-2-C-methyl-D-erythritol kinase [Rhodothermus profundi]
MRKLEEQPLVQLAPAKINLGLRVLRRRPDGYHDIETVLLRIPWTDRLTLTPADRFTFTCSDPALPTDERNLCVRAAGRLANLLHQPLTGWLHLDKRVPYGAGLGSGSSDAAATLQLLLRQQRTSLAPDVLHRLAADLGSDVPFFLLPAPAALATGRGEQLQPLSAYQFPFHLVVLVPSFRIATAEAYRLVQPRASQGPSLAEIVTSNDPERWQRELQNDFEAPLFARYPELKALKQWLRQRGAAYAALSGSGSALFGVFTERSLAEAAAIAARQRGLQCWQGQPDA